MEWVIAYIATLVTLELLILPRIHRKGPLLLLGGLLVILQFLPLFIIYYGDIGRTSLVHLIICYALLNAILLFNIYVSRTRSEKQAIRLLDSRKKAVSTASERTFYLIDEMIRNEKIYLNSSIKLSKIARSVHLSEKQVSSAINEIAGENFNSYINRLRIEEAKKLILDPQNNNYTIDAIAELAGFSNKVSFYKAFKKITKQSPTEYKVLKHS